MFGRTARRVKRLRICPVCGSTAVSDMCAEDVDELIVRVRLRCGVCGDRRDEAVAWHQADSLQTRLQRLLRRDRRAIEDDLRRIGVAGIECHDFERPETTQSLFY